MVNKLTTKNGVSIPFVTGCTMEKNGKYALTLWWYEKGAKNRTRKWISTDLPIKGNKVKVRALLREEIEKAENGLIEAAQQRLEPKEVLFGDFIKLWLKIVQPTLQERTYQDYRKKIENQIAPYFDEKRITLQKIAAADIQDFYSYKLKTVQGNTVRRYHANIRKALQYALKTKMISENPAAFVELPKVGKARIKYCNSEELQKILDLSMGTVFEVPVALAAYYGLRRSEALALRWSRIDFKAKTISISEKVSEITGASANNKSQLHFDETLKTEASVRVMPLIPEVEKVLRRKQMEIRENQKFFGNTYQTRYQDYACVKENGDLIRPDYITEFFPKFIQPLNLQKHITYHCLRHSCATMLLAMNFEIKEIQEWLGHGSYKTTADFYAHLDVKRKQKMGEKMNASLSTGQSKQKTVSHLSEV